MITIYINSEEDFSLLNNYKNKDKIIKIYINSDIDFKSIFKSIKGLNEYTIYIYGNNHILSHICINSSEDMAGIISSCKNLYVKDLNITNSSLIGRVLSGIICGNVENEVVLDNVHLTDTVVASEAYGGSVVGFCDELSIYDSEINAEVRGFDVVGGVAGMANSLTEFNNNIKCTIFGVGKALGNEVGYCERKYKKEGNKLSKRFHF